jgi:hypothetical protein
MGQPLALRQDYDATLLRRIARESEDADQVRRLLALAVIYEEGSRTEAAEVGGVTLQVVRGRSRSQRLGGSFWWENADARRPICNRPRALPGANVVAA